VRYSALTYLYGAHHSAESNLSFVTAPRASTGRSTLIMRDTCGVFEEVPHKVDFDGENGNKYDFFFKLELDLVISIIEHADAILSEWFYWDAVCM